MDVDAFGAASQNISAYAKLEFEQFSFFIQTLTLVIGRKAKRDDNVDVHLGTSKSISRVHAKIYYQFDAMSWEIEVLGKNGAFVNEHYVEAGNTYGLGNTDKLQIAEATFTFLLPDGATCPGNPLSLTDNFGLAHSPKATIENSTTLLSKPDDSAWLSPVAPTTPIAPHHLMRMTKPATQSTDPLGASSTNTADAVDSKLVTIKFPNTLDDSPTSPPLPPFDATLGLSLDHSSLASKTLAGHPAKKPRKKYTKKNQNPKPDDLDQQSQENEEVWPMLQHQLTPSPEPEVISLNSISAEPFGTGVTNLPEQVQTEEERKKLEEEAAAQHAAQLLHQERIARQAQEEEEGLILPPPETDPAVIADMQKPSASYATMIYNAIASHDKKKMTLAQIYSWICIFHPYYRYIQNGWQNSIRHNLSLNKAFKKVPRTDEEPGKGSFWAVDPDSEMLFEGGVYKKKPPRPTPTAPASRGAPVVMKDGKLALNPSYFVGGIQGKAEEVLHLLHLAVQKQTGHGNPPEQASQLARILALALATQLRQSAISVNGTRQVMQQSQTLNQNQYQNVIQNQHPHLTQNLTQGQIQIPNQQQQQQQQIPMPSRPVASTVKPMQAYCAPIPNTLSIQASKSNGFQAPRPVPFVQGPPAVPHVQKSPAESTSHENTGQMTLPLTNGHSTISAHVLPNEKSSYQAISSPNEASRQTQASESTDKPSPVKPTKRPLSDEVEQSTNKMQKFSPSELATETVPNEP